MKYQFIANHRDIHSVKKMARMLQVSRSGYYGWVGKPRSKRYRRDEMLVEVISSIQEDSKGRYGSLRVTRALRRRGHQVGHNHVARLRPSASIECGRTVFRLAAAGDTAPRRTPSMHCRSQRTW